MSIYESIRNSQSKQFAVLVDPDRHREGTIVDTALAANASKVDYLFVGGSLMTRDNLGSCLRLLKDHSDIPVVLFPGSLFQIDPSADAILLLSLISGRNPELLIGKHIVAAPYLRESGLEVIPTGYLLIDGGNITTAQYISNTLPIPSDKEDIAACTALAGEMLGLKLVYLDAGSGAKSAVPAAMIRSVRNEITLPLIVGGGIRTPEKAVECCRAGADLIVVGNAIENNHEQIKTIADAIHSL